MRGLKFKIILFLLCFGAAFWWAGGLSNVKKSIPPLPGSPSFSNSVNLSDLPQPSTFSLSRLIPSPPTSGGITEKLYRIVFFKNAVENKLNRDTIVTLEYVPLQFQQAIIAVEDNRFYRHFGLDIESILRASLVNMQSGTLVEGASTITQQLVKNLFLSQDRTWSRKGEEVILALEMELRYSKEEILEMYINNIYFGSGATGIGEASKIYFNKKPSLLTLPEAALLAGLPNAPSLYSPYENLAAAKDRQAIVIQAMVKNGFLGPSQGEEAKKTPLLFAKPPKE